MIDFAAKLAEIKQAELYRTQKILTSPQSTVVHIDNKQLINFSSNDYLSLANNDIVKQALIAGVKKYGVGSGASHLISGHFKVHTQLEDILADYLGCEKVLLFSSGYMANLAVFSALKDDIAWVLQDRLNHASLLDANNLIGFRINRYVHNDIISMEKKLQKLQIQYPKKTGLIASDVVFSMDGDIANIAELKRLSTDFGSLLLLDAAHSFAMQKIQISQNMIYMATLGKALGTMGAIVGGGCDFIDYLRQKARPFIYTTALAPALASASIAALDIVKSGNLQQKLITNIKYFKKLADNYNISLLPSNSAIQVIIIGNNKRLMLIAKQMYIGGFLLGAIRYPTVAKDTARLRISINARHTKEQIDKLLEALKNALA